MASEGAAVRILTVIVGIDGLQPFLLGGGRREAHRAGHVEHQIEIDVSRQRVACRRRARQRDVFVTHDSHEIGRNLGGEGYGGGHRRARSGDGRRRREVRVAGGLGRRGQIGVEEIGGEGRSAGNGAVARHGFGRGNDRGVDRDGGEACRVGGGLQFGLDHGGGRVIDGAAHGGDHRQHRQRRDHGNVAVLVEPKVGNKRPQPRQSGAPGQLLHRRHDHRAPSNDSALLGPNC